MQHLKIVPARSRATVTASAPGHAFKASGLGVEGTVELDGDRIVALSVSFPLAALEAGDPLGNHELKKFLDLGKKPIATATLVAERRIRFAIGPRNMETPVSFFGSNPRGSARFQLTFSGLGYTPPKLLFFKVKDTLEIEVSTELEPVAG